MKKLTLYPISLSIIFLLTFRGEVFASNIEVKDTIQGSTIWDADTVKITGDLFLDNNDTLYILPGTRVEFQGHFSFQFAGMVKAIGTAVDTIVFTINDTTWFSSLNTYLGGWESIEPVSTKRSTFNYCKFEYGKSLHPYQSPVTGYSWISFSHCLFQKIYSPVSAVYIEELNSCTIRDNYTSGVQAMDVNNSYISNNQGDGLILIQEWPYYAQWASGNIIENNSGYGISGKNLKMTEISNNTLSKNGGAIKIRNTWLCINNNIITGNKHFETINIGGGDFSSNLIADNVVDQNQNDTSLSAIIVYGGGKFYNNTVVSNKSNFQNGIFLLNGTSYRLINNIFWNNKSADTLLQINIVRPDSTTPVNIKIENCVIQNGLSGLLSDTAIILQKNNLYTDPLFDFPIGNYQLSKGSPCINNGANIFEKNLNMDAPNFPSQMDLAGNKRIIGQEDIGAYESLYDSIYVKYLNYQIDSIKICLDQNKELFIGTNISDSYTLNWQKDGTDLPGQNSPSLWLKPLKISDAGVYTLSGFIPNRILSDFTETIVVSFFESNYITDQSEDIIICEGYDTLFKLNSLTSAGSNYRWFKNNRPLVNSNDSIFQFHSVSLADTGFYYCVLDNGCSSDTSELIHLEVISRPDTNGVFFVTNIPEINKYEIRMNKSSYSQNYNWKLFYGTPDNLTLKTTLNNIDQLNYIDQISDPNNRPDIYLTQTEDLCSDNLLAKSIQKPLFVQYKLKNQDSLAFIIEKYEGLPADTTYIFKGTTLTSMTIADTVISKNSVVNIIETELPYAATYFCAAIKVTDTIFSYSNVFLKPRHNSVPSDITISSQIISENMPLGTVIGELETVDTDPADDHSYSLASNVAFYIDGNILKSNQVFDYETINQYSLSIKSIDNGPGNLYLDKEFTVSINNIEEETGIDVKTYLDEISVYPNPFSSSTTIRLKNQFSEIQEIKLVNMIGEVVFLAVNIKSNTFVLNKANLAPGSYVAVITSNLKAYHQSIVIN
jgi:hypothetical protein